MKLSDDHVRDMEGTVQQHTEEIAMLKQQHEMEAKMFEQATQREREQFQREAEHIKISTQKFVSMQKKSFLAYKKDKMKKPLKKYNDGIAVQSKLLASTLADLNAYVGVHVLNTIWWLGVLCSAARESVADEHRNLCMCVIVGMTWCIPPSMGHASRLRYAVGERVVTTLTFTLPTTGCMLPQRGNWDHGIRRWTRCRSPSTTCHPQRRGTPQVPLATPVQATRAHDHSGTHMGTIGINAVGVQLVPTRRGFRSLRPEACKS
eukprot:m.1089427 g.1089427  ORF g.1089427 m.1089427 type:complete len:262 (+) comp24286_c1_seq53:3206-3991(+)